MSNSCVTCNSLRLSLVHHEAWLQRVAALAAFRQSAKSIAAIPAAKEAVSEARRILADHKAHCEVAA